MKFLVVFILVVTVFSQAQAACSYQSLGCWTDTSNRAIAKLEGTDKRLTGWYQERQNAVEICFQVARSKGFPAFAIQHGGQCFGSSSALDTYQKYGKKEGCYNGKGGGWANDVYQITCGETTPTATPTATTGCPFEIASPLFTSSYEISSPAPQWNFKFQTNPTKIENTLDSPTYEWTPDGHLSSVYNSVQSIWYHFQPNFKTYRASGQGPLPQDMQQLSPNSAVMGGYLPDDAYNSGGEWLMALHPTGQPGYFTGFIHVEDIYRNLRKKGTGGPAFKSIALACSSDWGQTWSKRGRIMTKGTKPSQISYAGIGDFDVVWDWQESRWMMIMQNEISNKGSKLTAAVSYDKTAAADSWKKWDGTNFTVSNWEQPGEYLRDTERNKTLNGANPSIHWNSFLQVWIMVYGGWDGNTYITSATKLPYFTLSRVLIEGESGPLGTKNWYPTLMSATEGDREGGEHLHLYYRLKKKNKHGKKWSQYFMTREIKLSRD